MLTLGKDEDKNVFMGRLLCALDLIHQHQLFVHGYFSGFEVQ